jgi:hypothetical protein
MTSNYAPFAPGDFSWIDVCPDYHGSGYGKGSDKEMFSTAYEAINTTPGGWEFMKNDSPGNGGYMFGKCDDAEMQSKIESEIHKRYGGHSGASFGITMRNMQYIAKKGWEQWIRYNWPSYKPTPPPVHPLLDVITPTPIMNVITSNPSNLSEFINRIETTPGIRQHIPDLDDQVDALKQFQSGKMSYAEMRSRCG